MKKELYMETEPTTEELNAMEETCESMEADERKEDYYTEDSMKMYLKEIAKIPRLTAEEEKELGKIIAEGGPGAMAARNTLVSANLRLVMHYAKKYTGRGVELSDLNAMGYEGLFKAAEKFDYTRGFKFGTYASWWIVQAITRGIANESETVRVPVHMTDTVHRVKRAQKELEQKYMEPPTIEEIALYLHIPEEKVMAAVEAMHSIVSFETKIGEEGDTTMEDMLADERAVNPCEAAMQEALKEAVSKVLVKLEPREAMVIKLRYGIGRDCPMTLEEIASLPQFGVSRERIRQIEEKAKRKIRRVPSMRCLLEDYVNAS